MLFYLRKQIIVKRTTSIFAVIFITEIISQVVSAVWLPFPCTEFLLSEDTAGIVPATNKQTQTRLSLSHSDCLYFILFPMRE